jgi:hypothetical protein
MNDTSVSNNPVNPFLEFSNGVLHNEMQKSDKYIPLFQAILNTE